MKSNEQGVAIQRPQRLSLQRSRLHLLRGRGRTSDVRQNKMEPPTDLKSVRLGPLVLDCPDEDPDEILGLRARFNLPSEGDFYVNLPDVEQERIRNEWLETVNKLDRDFDALMEKVQEIRGSITLAVIKLASEAWMFETPPKSAEDLKKVMKLKSLSYFATREFRVYYELGTGHPDFQNVDLFVDADQDWNVTDVYFDG